MARTALLFAAALASSMAAGTAANEPPRVRAARARALPAIHRAFESAGASYPPRALLIRAFKREALLELWAGPVASGPYVKVKTWPICAASGGLGPKRREGDLQVPEGFYRITQLNPWSAFHLSLRVDYPNRSDRLLGRRPLGGDIFIHGGYATVGCLPLGDEGIEELYLAAADAMAAGAEVAVHLFPTRLDAAGLSWLVQQAKGDAKLVGFWRELAEGYGRFERTRRPAPFRISRAGRYVFTGEQAHRADR